MKAVNLLPHEIPGLPRRRRLDRLLVGGGAGTLAVVAALAGAFVLFHGRARVEQRELATARAALARAQALQRGAARQPSILSSPAVLSQVQPWRQAVESALATRVPWDQTLAELARIVPAGVTLSSLTLGATGTGAAAPLTLSGKASSRLCVVQLLSRLTLVPEIGQVTLGATTTDPASGVISFSIQAQMTGAAAASPAAGASTPSTTSGGAA